MTDPAVLWPTLLGLSFLAAGLFTYRRELLAARARGVLGFAVLAPILVAASLATFSGEHFTAARGISELVPKWLPARLPITYFVGAALLAAALSLVARKYLRLSTLALAVMFASFVALIYLPSAMRHPDNRIVWIFPFREGTFAIGSLALFALAAGDRWPNLARRLATAMRVWIAIVLTFYGVMNLWYPQFSPGVPDNKPMSTWVLPFPLAIAYATGILLMVFGAAAFVKRYTVPAVTCAGLLMVLLTLGIYVPEYALARNVAEHVDAFNFVADTLLFAGMLFAIANVNARFGAAIEGRLSRWSI